MKHQLFAVKWAMVLLLASHVGMWAQAAPSLPIGLNRIEGRVMDESNMGVNNVYVELYDNLGSVVARQRTTGQGRFSFRGMGPGRYVIYAKPFGTNLKEDSRDIEINNQSSRSDTVMVDFRLRLDTRSQPKDPGVVGTVFAQEVPVEAERLYKSGIDSLELNRAKGIADLEGAVKAYPKYFNALAALGKAQITDGKYAAGYPYLLKAIDVNQKCSDCYYSLALAFYKLSEADAAVKAIDAAAVLRPNEPVVRLMQGMVYRSKDNLAGAEKALLLAKKLYEKPNPEVHWQLSLVYNRLKKNAEAASELEQYLKSKPDIEKTERDNVQGLIAKLRASK